MQGSGSWQKAAAAAKLASAGSSHVWWWQNFSLFVQLSNLFAGFDSAPRLKEQSNKGISTSMSFLDP